jgi:hypothetical protein
MSAAAIAQVVKKGDPGLEPAEKSGERWLRANMSGRHDDGYWETAGTRRSGLSLSARRRRREVEEISRIVEVAAVFRASELLLCNRGPTVGENVHFEPSN